jgi:hypothetical protein
MSALRAAAVGLVFLSGAAAAESQEWTAAPDSSLAALRGGFATDSGLVVSFGIARTVQIDGQVVSRTSFGIDGLTQAGTQQARALAQGAGQFAIVQNGTGNSVAPLRAQPLAGLLLQNTESNRLLQAATVIDVTSNSLGLMQRLNFNQSLSDALRLGR